MRRSLISLILILISVPAFSDSCPECKLVEAVLRGDTLSVTASIREGADVNGLVIAIAPPGTRYTDAAVYPFDEKYLGPDGVEAWTALDAAMAVDNTEALVQLLQAGADPNRYRGRYISRAIRRGSMEQVSALLKSPLNEESVRSGWLSILSESRKKDMTDYARMFLEAGMDVNLTDDRGNNLLEHADRLGADPKVVEVLRNAGAEYSFTSPLTGTWLYPAMNNSPGATAKMVFLEDGTGSLYDRTEDAEPMIGFTFRFYLKKPEEGLYHVLHDYAPDNRWYACIQIVEMGDITMMYWGSWGQNIEQFPETLALNPPFQWNGIKLKE